MKKMNIGRRSFRMKRFTFLIMLNFIINPSLSVDLTSSSDILSSNQSLKYGESLVSSGQTFELGFFSPGSSRKHYLGIWYKWDPRTVVWVANRNNPLNETSGVLSINYEGNLVLLNQSKGIIWSTNSSKLSKNPFAQLLDSGNLVVRDSDSEDSDQYLWQSFDYPSDTLLPGLKMGWNSETGLERHLTSWKSLDDPSSGNYTYKLSNTGLPHFVLSMGTITKYRTGPWNGIEFTGTEDYPVLVFKPIFFFSETETYYMFESRDSGINTRVTLSATGIVQRLSVENGSAAWDVTYCRFTEQCDSYNKCGANAICKDIDNKDVSCTCMPGFMPISLEEWKMQNWSKGCMRTVPLNCSAEEGFLPISGAKLPDLLEFWLDEDMNLEECRVECIRNCSCTAYANSDVQGGGSGCLMWFGNLIDVKELQQSNTTYQQNIYVRLPGFVLESFHHDSSKKKRWIIIGVSATTGLLILGITFCFVRWKGGKKKKGLESIEDGIELPLFEFSIIAAATNNFSQANMIGEGGFGPVYRGKLLDGQEIAVKRLSKNSGQGLEEFMNEVVVIVKLQHRNLVGILGCCIAEEERMLIYEYMPNRSLDYFLFDRKRCSVLSWKTRFDIAMGIARGLLYLHQDSKLQVIHRDLKSSNILLDANMNPKISDFGLARIFGGNEKEEKTKRIIGTYGYMSPEYAFNGKFSVKSDVFSYGVLLLELVTGKRNRGFYNPNHHHSLLGHAWLLWCKDEGLELMDDCLYNSFVERQVQRCIHIGLLCVQKFPGDRPEMSDVIFMLGNEEADLPSPKQPGFFNDTHSEISDGSAPMGVLSGDNSLTITMPEGR